MLISGNNNENMKIWVIPNAIMVGDKFDNDFICK